MARPRLPDSLKKLRGTFRKDRQAPRVKPKAAAAVAASPASVVGDPPADFTDLQRQVWCELGRALDERPGTFTEADRPAFRLTVEAVAATRSMSDETPATARVAATKAAAALLAAFGLLPVARSRVTAAPPKAEAKRASVEIPGDLTVDERALFAGGVTARAPDVVAQALVARHPELMAHPALEAILRRSYGVA